MSAGRRKNDSLDRYYTPAAPTRKFLREWMLVEGDGLPRSGARILEPAAGAGAMLAPLMEAFGCPDVEAIDIAPENEGIRQQDFLEFDGGGYDVIFTNPPFRLAEQYARHALRLVVSGGYVVLLLRAGFLESEARHNFFDEFPLLQVWFLRKRPRFTGPNSDGATTDTAMYAWFVWKKGERPDHFEGRWI